MKAVGIRNKLSNQVGDLRVGAAGHKRVRPVSYTHLTERQPNSRSHIAIYVRALWAFTMISARVGAERGEHT